MPEIFKQQDLDFREAESPGDHFNLLTATPRMFDKVKSKHLIFDMRMLPAGEYSFPYHFHHNAEELFVILSGTATLRSPEGFQTVETGDIIFFEIGETSAHQLYNHGAESCIYLDIRTNMGFDVSEYPDSEKVNIIPAREIFSKGTSRNYFDGEENVAEKWKNKK